MSHPQPNDSTAIAIENCRSDFPVLQQEINGQPLVFLDSAASAQQPTTVIDAVAEYQRHDHANVHRGVHTLSHRATDAYEGARDKIQAFIHAASRREIVLTSGTTESINLVAQSYCRPRLGPGNKILISHLEHHSNIVPWQLVCEQTGAELVVTPMDDVGQLDLEAFKQLLSTEVQIVSIGHVSNALGTINPIKDIIAQAHAQNIPVLIDGAQGVPHLPIDVQDLGCDFYAFSAHKMFGPTGVGVLYGRESLLEEMPPYQGGGDMIETVTFERTTYGALPHKFEAGTPHIAGAIGLAEAVAYLQDLGLDAIARYEHHVLAYAHQRLQEIDDLRLIGTAAEKASVVSFLVGAIHPYDAGTILDRLGIAVRTGHHCTMPLMQRFGLPGTVRASFALYNTTEEVDKLVEGLHKVKKLLG